MNKTVRGWWIASGIMLVLFGVSLGMDAARHTAADSAPFWAYAAARAIEFLIPALIFAIIALYLQFFSKKHRR